MSVNSRMEREFGERLRVALLDPSTSPDAIQDLLDSVPGFAPERIRYGRITFETNVFGRMCRMSACQDRLHRHDSMWHKFCRSASPGVIAVILSENRRRSCGLDLEVVDHKTSIEHLWRRYILNQDDEEYFEPRSYNDPWPDPDEARMDALSGVNSLEDVARDEEMSVLWQKTEVFLRDLAAHRGYVGWHPLHFALRQEYPPLIIWFLSRVFSSSASVKDGEGHLALELIIKQMKHNGTWSAYGYYGNMRAFHVSFEREGFDFSGDGPPRKRIEKVFPGAEPPFRYILQASPEVSRQRIYGRLPLGIVARADDVYTSYRENPLFEATDVLLLARAEPRALYTRDWRTKMYPFMDAAVAKKCCKKKMFLGYTKECCLQHLDMVYLLLRENPNVLKLAMKPKKTFDE